MQQSIMDAFKLAYHNLSGIQTQFHRKEAEDPNSPMLAFLPCGTTQDWIEIILNSRKLHLSFSST